MGITAWGGALTRYSGSSKADEKQLVQGGNETMPWRYWFGELWEFIISRTNSLDEVGETDALEEEKVVVLFWLEAEKKV